MPFENTAVERSLRGNGLNFTVIRPFGPRPAQPPGAPNTMPDGGDSGHTFCYHWQAMPACAAMATALPRAPGASPAHPPRT